MDSIARSELGLGNSVNGVVEWLMLVTWLHLMRDTFMCL